MVDKTDKENKAQATHDSLVDALESIKSLLQKSDAKLSAARESIAIASNQTHQGSKNIHDSEQLEIPVLDDIVIPAAEASQISDQIEETLKSIQPDEIPVLTEVPLQPDPQVMLDYLDRLQKQLEKTLRDSLMKSIVTIETGLKKSLTNEIDKIREQIRQDFK